MYEDVITFLERVEATSDFPHRRRRFTSEQIEARRRRHPGISEEYLMFLVEVGCGAIDARRVAVFCELIEPSYFFGEEVLGLDGSFVCFGQDIEGNYFAFSFGDWQIVVLDGRTRAVAEQGHTFSEFIRRRIVEDRTGSSVE